MEMKLMFKVMHKNSGFTIMELMVTIAIIGLLTAIAIPNMINWRSGTKLQGVVENLRGDLQWAKLAAVKGNVSVEVQFPLEGDKYLVVPGDGPTKERRLPTGVSIDVADFNGNEYVRFNNRGLPEDPGTVVINSSGGEGRTINLNRLGLIEIKIN
jgi:type IV fimbrial biogenesis protein FimT